MRADTHAKPLASNTVGGQEPSPDLSPKGAAARILRSYRTMTPAVLKALPECDAPHLSAREIAERVNFGSRSTIRGLLANMVKAGIADSLRVDCPRGEGMVVYRRAAKAAADDFEESTAVYGDGE